MDPAYQPMLRAVAGVVERAARDGRILVGFSRKYPLGRNAVLPGGGVEDGEDDATALCREFLEECGVILDPASIRRLGHKTGTTAAGRRYECHLYGVEISAHPDALVFTDAGLRAGGDIVSAAWCEPSKVLDGPHAEDFDCARAWTQRLRPPALNPTAIPPQKLVQTTAFVDHAPLENGDPDPRDGLRTIEMPEYPHSPHGETFRELRRAVGGISFAASMLGLRPMDVSGLECGRLALSDADWLRVLGVLARVLPPPETLVLDAETLAEGVPDTEPVP